MAWAAYGVGVGDGLALGRVCLFSGTRLEASRQTLAPGDLPAERSRLDHAVAQIRAEIDGIRSSLGAGLTQDLQTFLELQEILLEDPLLVTAASARITEEACNAEWALLQQYELLAARFDEIDDDYLRERKLDVTQLVTRIFKAMRGDQSLGELLAALPETPASELPWILVADDVSPADMLLLRNHGFAGLITDGGSATAHTAILARSLGLPTVVGIPGLHRLVRDHEVLALDAEAGVVMGSLDDGQIAEQRKRMDDQALALAGLQRLIQVPALTRDGSPVKLLANIDLPDDLEAVQRVGCDGIGLFRTEFLFMNRETVPDEAEQFAAYQAVVTAMAGRPVTIRTLDAGADKSVPAVQRGRPEPDNPALALRAVRLCLAEPELFLVQLRAILRASALGPIQLLIPMVSGPAEIIQARQMIQQAMRQLQAQGQAFDPKIPVGAMIEIPSAAIHIQSLLDHIDFASIGTNDLIQYTLAVDRTDPAVAHLYEPLHPAVLQLIAQVIAACDRRSIPVSLCGEMAGESRYTPLLLGMGLRHFSMHAVELLRVKGQVLKVNAQNLQEPVERLIRLSDAGLIRQGLDGLLTQHAHQADTIH